MKEILSKMKWEVTLALLILPCLLTILTLYKLFKVENINNSKQTSVAKFDCFIFKNEAGFQISFPGKYYFYNPNIANGFQLNKLKTSLHR